MRRDAETVRRGDAETRRRLRFLVGQLARVDQQIAAADEQVRDALRQLAAQDQTEAAEPDGDVG